MVGRNDRIRELKEMISSLPQGNITYKTIRGAKRMYLNGRYVRAANEFTNAVNRIIEDMNYRFLVSVITRDFKSHDLGSASQIDRKRSALKGSTSILDHFDEG